MIEFGCLRLCPRGEETPVWILSRGEAQAT